MASVLTKIIARKWIRSGSGTRVNIGPRGTVVVLLALTQPPSKLSVALIDPRNQHRDQVQRHQNQGLNNHGPRARQRIGDGREDKRHKYRPAPRAQHVARAQHTQEIQHHEHFGDEERDSEEDDKAGIEVDIGIGLEQRRPSRWHKRLQNLHRTRHQRHAGNRAAHKQHHAHSTKREGIPAFLAFEAGNDEGTHLVDPPRAGNNQSDPQRDPQLQVEGRSNCWEVDLGIRVLHGE